VVKLRDPGSRDVSQGAAETLGANLDRLRDLAAGTRPAAVTTSALVDQQGDPGRL
jgi:hypothetical protein